MKNNFSLLDSQMKRIIIFGNISTYKFLKSAEMRQHSIAEVPFKFQYIFHMVHAKLSLEIQHVLYTFYHVYSCILFQHLVKNVMSIKNIYCNVYQI